MLAQAIPDYLAWRTERGDTDSFGQLLAQPMTIRYFDEIDIDSFA